MFSFEIKDAIDIFLVALMLYYTYRFMRESRSINVFIGILVFILIWLLVSRVVEMRFSELFLISWWGLARSQF